MAEVASPAAIDVASAVDSLDAIVARSAELSDLASGAAGWADAERRRVLARLDHVVDALTAVRATVLLAERASGGWRGSGDRSFEAWRARTARTGERSAVAQVRQAEHVVAVPAAAVAVTEGRIGLEHAAAIGRAVASGSVVQRSAVTSAGGQALLLRLAEDLDAASFATAVARWTATMDPDVLERDHEDQRRARYLHVADSPRGAFIKGRLDRMAGHRLVLALEALSPRPAAEDDRDPGQRRADALDAMAGCVLASADTKPGGHVPPQVTMILTERTWVAARAERDRRRRERRRDPDGWSAVGRGRVSGGGSSGGARVSDTSAGRSGNPVGMTGDATAPAVSGPPATLEDGTPVPASELAAALCDCEITRVVIDAHGAPLDLGRSERLFSGAQRRAVIARDRGCAWPQCGAHARWCEVHHIRWWERDAGPTSVENGVLLCSYHHHEVHRRDLAITRVGGRETGRGSGRDVGRDSDRDTGRVANRDRERRASRDGGTSVGRSSRSSRSSRSRSCATSSATTPAGSSVDRRPTPSAGGRRRRRPGDATAPGPRWRDGSEGRHRCRSAPIRPGGWRRRPPRQSSRAPSRRRALSRRHRDPRRRRVPQRHQDPRRSRGAMARRGSSRPGPPIR